MSYMTKMCGLCEGDKLRLCCNFIIQTIKRTGQIVE